MHLPCLWKNLEAHDGSGQLIKQSMYAQSPGDEVEIVFDGTGILLTGNWFRDGGKADVFVDGLLHRRIDTYYYFAGQQHVETIWHVTNLQPGKHKVKIVVSGEKRPESEGTRVYITGLWQAQWLLILYLPSQANLHPILPFSSFPLEC
jgi:hypothetical protein